MDIDSRALPAPEATEPMSKDINSELKAEDTTSQNDPVESVNTDLQAELESLKTKNLEFQKQKDHWKEKYERDIVSKSSELDEDLFSDEGKLLRTEILSLKETLSKFEKEKEEQTIYSQYPQLQDKKDEFIEFSNDPDNVGIKKEKLVKLFLLEKGLLDSKPQRKGLEKPTGGSKSVHKSGIAQDEIKRLRENQPRRYQQYIQSGKINPDEIV